MVKGKHAYKLDFDGHEYLLYQHSYDGYGLMQGRLRVSTESLTKKTTPCVTKDRQYEFKKDTSLEKLQGTGENGETCIDFIKQSLFTNQQCNVEPCSFDGVYMPKISPSDNFYAFSYFYDNFATIFGLDKEFKVGDLKQAVYQVCLPPSRQRDFKSDIQDRLKDSAWCMDLSFMYTLLNIGYSMPDDKVLKTAKKIDGIEMGWSLGSAIQLLDTRMALPEKRLCSHP